MNNFYRNLANYPWAVLVFLSGISLSLVIGYNTKVSNEKRIHESMQESLDSVSDNVLDKVNLYQYGLRGARGAVLTAGERGISRNLFYRYSKTRDIDKEFPGARGFGFIRRVPADEIEHFLQTARTDGWPDFNIREITPNPGEKYVIQYIEPVDRNKAAVGLDIASESNRFAAAKAAILTGEVQLTGPITLVQASGLPLKSFLILMPIYRTTITPETALEREQEAFGWIYAPLIITEILSTVRVDSEKFTLNLEDVTDLTKPILFFSSSNDVTGIHSVSLVKTVYGRDWKFILAAKPIFINSLNLLSPVHASLFGALATLLLSFLVGLLEVNQRNKKQLFAQQAKQIAVVESSADGIISCSLDGQILSWNRGAESLFGYAKEDALNKNFQMLVAQPDSACELLNRLSGVSLGKPITNYETVYRSKDGALIDVSITLSPIFSEKGAVIAASKTVRDITKQKLVEAQFRELNTNLEAKVQQRTAEIATLNLLFKNVLDSASDFAIIASDTQGVIQC